MSRRRPTADGFDPSAPGGQPPMRSSGPSRSAPPAAKLDHSMPRRKPPERELVDELRALGAVVTPCLELLDRLPDTLFWIKDAKRQFRWVNRAIVVLNGHKSRSDLIGTNDREVSELPGTDEFLYDDEKAMSGEPVLGRIELVVFNHVGRWYSTTKLPLRNARGKIVGTVGIAIPMQQVEAEGGGSSLAIAMNFIGKNFRTQINNRKIARVAGMSLRVFHREFWKAYHSTPRTYIRKLRVRMSCQALAFTKRPLTAIAHEFGFSDQSHFSREFRVIMKMTPSAYRTWCQQ
jgi:AraC-like DNA-binding protein